ncbi:MAG: shikimate dehydrogenase [Ginsengibacter sp.]
MKKLYGLIGYPLGHSFSKKYFTDKFEKENITDTEYKLFPIEHIDGLKAIVANNPNLAGLNITIPHKQSVLKFATHLSDAVKEIGAANILKFTSSQVEAYNTDVIGFEKSLLTELKAFHKKTLILGTGGSSNAVQFVCRKLGIEYLLVSRNKSERAISYADLGQDIMSNYLVIINTTPLGTFPDTASFPEIPYIHITNKHYCFDLVYNPPKTVFLTKAEEQGATIKNGYDMLVIQAQESWKIWNA